MAAGKTEWGWKCEWVWGRVCEDVSFGCESVRAGPPPLGGCDLGAGAAGQSPALSHGHFSPLDWRVWDVEGDPGSSTGGVSGKQVWPSTPRSQTGMQGPTTDTQSLQAHRATVSDPANLKHGLKTTSPATLIGSGQALPSHVGEQCPCPLTQTPSPRSTQPTSFLHKWNAQVCLACQMHTPTTPSKAHPTGTPGRLASPSYHRATVTQHPQKHGSAIATHWAWPGAPAQQPHHLANIQYPWSDSFLIRWKVVVLIF